MVYSASFMSGQNGAPWFTSGHDDPVKVVQSNASAKEPNLRTGITIWVITLIYVGTTKS